MLDTSVVLAATLIEERPPVPEYTRVTGRHAFRHWPRNVTQTSVTGVARAEWLHGSVSRMLLNTAHFPFTAAARVCRDTVSYSLRVRVCVCVCVCVC